MITEFVHVSAAQMINKGEDIGAGTRVENVLMNWTIKGHHRYFK